MISVTLNMARPLAPDRLVCVFKKLLIYWDLHVQPSFWFDREQSKKGKISRGGGHPRMKSWRRAARLVWADRKKRVTQITSIYVLLCIRAFVNVQHLETVYNRRKPPQVSPLVLNMSLQFGRLDESTWKHESILPESTVQAAASDFLGTLWSS